MSQHTMTSARVHELIDAINSTPGWVSHIRAISSTAGDFINGRYVFPNGQPPQTVLMAVREAAHRIEQCHSAWNVGGTCTCRGDRPCADTITLAENLTGALYDYLLKFV